MKFQDYYEVLGVSRNASEDEIKKAYHKLALKWHPDRHQGPTRADAEEKFKQVNEAKEVLLDPEKRRKYDQFGQNWQHGEEFTPPAGAGRVRPEDFERMFGASGFSDFFASMFGDDVLGPRRARKRRFGSRGADVNAELRLSIGQAIAGGKRSFKLDAIAACAHCGGEGQLEDDHVCPVCAGLGRVRTEKTVELSIPKHVQDSMQLRLKGLGEAGENGGPSGDLYLTLVLDTDGTYRRAGLDIEADLPLAPWEALDGARVRLQTLDGTATLNVPPGTVWGAKLRMKGLGLTDAGGRRGDFYAIVRLALPESMSERQRELVRQMRDAGAGEIHGGARL